MKSWMESVAVLVLALVSAGVVAQGQPARAEVSVVHAAAVVVPEVLWAEVP